MSNIKSTFAKIASSPTPAAWAQVYHAGNVYAVVSVQQKTEKPEDPEHALPSVLVLGKEIINNIEAEYFTIAEKNLQTIKEAITNACTTIPENVRVSILVAVVIDHILYLFLYGHGKILLKRQEKLGVILQENSDNKQVSAGSGFIQGGDIVILQTGKFSDAISQSELTTSLNQSFSEIQENFAAKVDDEQYAGAAAAFISFQTQQQIPEDVIEGSNLSADLPDVHSEAIRSSSAETTYNSEKKEDKLSLEESHHLTDELDPEIGNLSEEQEKPKKKLFSFSKKQFFFLSLAFILAGILLFSIIKSIHTQHKDQSETLFSSEYPSAQQKYDEGQSLLSLNKTIATVDFQRAKTTLENLETKLPSNSPHQSQITGLLAKVNQALGITNSGQTTTLTPADSGSKLLEAEAAANASYATMDTNNPAYVIDTNAISQIDTKGNKTTLVKNNNDWTDIGGFGTYTGNFYVLDKKANQIEKFTKSDSGYNKTNYLQDSVAVAKGISLTIDGSLWVLSDDSSIKKFTKGKQDQFSMQQLQKPLTYPTRIFTTDSIDNLYILDPQNNRILSIKKDGGNLVNEYDAKELKDAKDIDVDEKNKKIYVLINNKIFQMDMK